MLKPERHGELEFATVHVDQLDEAIEVIKTILPDDETVCSECEYAGETYRWGIKTYDTTDPKRSALILCCPSCETHIDLPLDLE